MTGALLSFCAMAVSVRVLAGTLSVMEILALRAGLGLAVMASLAATRADLRATINSGTCRCTCFATRFTLDRRICGP